MSRSACRLSRDDGASWYLPDKEFRYLRHFCYVQNIGRLGRFCSAQLSTSPQRSDHIFTPYGAFSVWPLRILSSTSSIERRRCLPSWFIA
jgi:hypothetical protein